MPIDFKASQIRTNKIIASGSDLKPYLIVYPSGSSTDQVGGITRLSGTGSDSWLFISGGLGNDEKVVFGGEASVSGTFVVSPRLTDSLFYASVNSNSTLSRIGIKNNTPETTLHVGGTTDPGLLVDTGAVINYGRNNSSSATFLVQGKLGGDHGLLVVSGCCDRVSIGKHNPNAKLDVYGDGIYSGSLTVTGSLVARSITGSLQYIDTALTTPFFVGDGVSYSSLTEQWQISGDAFSKSLQTPTWRGVTSGSGQTEIFIDGLSKRYSIPINSAQSYIILAHGRQRGGSSGTIGDSRWFRIEGAIKNVNGSASLIGLNTTYDDGDAGTSSWDITLEAEASGNSLVAKVTGEADKEIDWSIVAYPANNLARALTLDGQFNWYGSTVDATGTEIFLDGISKRFPVKTNGNHTFSLICSAHNQQSSVVYTRSSINVTVVGGKFRIQSLSFPFNYVNLQSFGVLPGDFIEFGNDNILYEIVSIGGGLFYDVSVVQTPVAPAISSPLIVTRESKNSRWFKIDGGIKNVAGTTSMVGVTTTYDDGDSGASLWDISVDADDANDTLRISVTGSAATNIDWHASGYISDADIQTVNFPNDTVVWQGVTTGSGYVELFNGGISKRLVIPENRTFGYQIIAHGYQTNGAAGSPGDSHWFRINGAVKNVSGTVSLLGSNYIYDDSDIPASSWDIVVDADNSNNSIRVSALGEGNKSIEWFVKGYVTDITSLVGVGCGRPSGVGGHVQFNDGGIFGSDSSFSWNKYTSTLTATNITGSITKVSDGSDYLVAGSNITITTSSNGSITISSAGGGGGGDSYFSSTTAGSIYATGSTAFIGGEVGVDSPSDKGSDVFFYVSGSRDGDATALFGGNVVASGSVDFKFNSTFGSSASDLFTVNASLNSNIIPMFDSFFTLGSPTNRFAHVYTGDLHLRNERGDWTFIEEEEYLTLRNNKTGKRYKLSMSPLED